MSESSLIKVPSSVKDRKEANEQFTRTLLPLITRNNIALRTGKDDTSTGRVKANVWATNMTAYETIPLQHKLAQEMAHDEDLVDRYNAIKHELDISHLDSYKLRLEGIFDEDMGIADLKNIGKRKRGEKSKTDTGDGSSDSTSEKRPLVKQESSGLEQQLGTKKRSFEQDLSETEQQPSNKQVKSEQDRSTVPPQLPSSNKQTLDQVEEQPSTKNGRSDNAVFDFGTLVENAKKGFVDLKALDHALEFLGDVFAVSNAVTKRHIQDSCEKMWT